jgi:hypothetical protein
VKESNEPPNEECAKQACKARDGHQFNEEGAGGKSSSGGE